MPTPAEIAKAKALSHALGQAAASGDASAARAALEKGANPLAQDIAGWTPLMCAAYHGHFECAALLFPLSDARARSRQRETALMMAAHRGKADLVALLLPASDAAAFCERGANALMLAAASGHADCARLLLPASDAKSQDGRRGWTALMYAAMSNNADCVDALLPFSDPHARNSAGETALLLAAGAGHSRVIERLLPVSKPNAKNRKGQNALIVALELENHPSLAILAAACDWTLKKSEHPTAFEKAAAQGRRDAVEAMSPWATQPQLQFAVSQFGDDASRLPRVFARLEALALAQELAACAPAEALRAVAVASSEARRGPAASSRRRL